VGALAYINPADSYDLADNLAQHGDVAGADAALYAGPGVNGQRALTLHISENLTAKAERTSKCQIADDTAACRDNIAWAAYGTGLGGRRRRCVPCLVCGHPAFPYVFPVMRYHHAQGDPDRDSPAGRRLMKVPLRLVSVLSTLVLLASCGPTATPVEKIDALLLAPGAEGIDLSHHNGAVDWPRLSTAGFSFVYLKATEGEGHIDTRFQENWQGALRHHWQAGAYHFYLLCQDGRRQAANFIRQVEVRGDALPPAVDLEHAQNCAPRGTRAETIAEIKVFLAGLEEEYGAVPVIYTTPTFHAEWLDGEGFDAHPLWVRSLEGPPRLPYAIWQYSMKGRVPGVSGNVDLNRAAD